MLAVSFAGMMMAQKKSISGVVKDATGEPIIGASIVVVGTTVGTVTDLSGKFTLELPANAKNLEITYVGMEKKTVPITGTEINVTLQDESTGLDELVVVGYGTMKKRDLTGSTTTIKADAITNVKAPNALAALQGRVSGLDIMQGSGEAGSGVSFMLRGRRSISSGNGPLVIVDGVEYGSTLDINSSDIESVDILKDAASTAIYGTRGANGVIMVTTKRGSSGKTKVSYNTYFSSNSPMFLPHIMNGAEYLQKQFDIKTADADVAKWNAQGVSYSSGTNTVTWNRTLHPDPNSVWGTSTLDELVTAGNKADKYELITGDPEGLELARSGASLNYLDMIMVNSLSQNHEISVTGGNQASSFNVSLGYLNDNGMLRNDNMNRYNFKVGVDHKISKTIKIGANVLLTKKDYNKRNSSVFNQALKAGPIGKLYEDDGITYRPIPDLVFAYNQNSPMLDEVEGAASRIINNTRVFSNLYAEWNILPSLTFKSTLGIDISTNKDGQFNGPKSLSQATVGKSISSLSYSDNFGYTLDNTLNYSKRFGIHNIQALAGTSTQYSRGQSLSVTTSGQATPSTLWYDQNYVNNSTTTSTWSPYQMVSLFGRINYSLKDRYLFQATVRNDNASQLAKGHKSAVFPSVSAGWRISEEQFLKDVTFISNLKLRYSWGVAGNASSAVAYGTLASVSTNTDYYTMGSTIYQQYAPASVANNFLTWEKTATHDIGLDFGILKDRISGSVDFYQSNSNDLIFQIPLPTNQGGYSVAYKNIAASQNKGVEISLNTLNVKSHNFEWSTDWGLSFNENKLTELYSDVDQMLGGYGIWKVGSQINSFYQYQIEGLYSIADMQSELDYVKETQDAGGTIDKLKIPMLANKWYPGDVKVKDQNQDGLYNDADKVAVGADPKYIFNFNNNFNLATKFGNFGLSVLTIGRVDQNFSYGLYSSVKTATNKENGSYVKTWSPNSSNDGVIFPRYYTTGTGVTRSDFMSSLAIVNGSFVKIKDITLSYMFPKQVVNGLKISNAKLYTSAKNMFTFSNIENYDPESNGSLNFPLAKQWIVGLNLEF